MRRQSVLFLLVLFCGCAYFGQKKHKPVTSPPKKTAQTDKTANRQMPADPMAQQRFYDQGMKYYSQENYAEAKRAWQQCVQAGPGAPLADKARDYLKKTEQVLKTLKEFEHK